MKKRYVLKNKTRFFTFLSTIFILSVVIAFTGNVYGYKEPNYTTVKVKSGDTLWNIVMTNYNDKADIRKNIYEIKKINNLVSSEIFEGTQLLIPVK
jgi:nucleoid-associated protein YgaU